MAKDSPIQFKGTTLKIIHSFLQTTDLAVLHAALGDLTGNAPDFFENELALLDFREAQDLPASADWVALRDLLRGSGLQAVATLGLPETLAHEAAACGLPCVSPDALGRISRPAKVEAPEPAPAAPQVETVVQAAPQPLPPAAVPTLTVDKPLRSGQRIYARGGDLIVTAMVSAGAEVIADGNIHIYAPLRGRALAGAAGDKSARIFTTCLEAELVSVAGIYRTFEAGVPAQLASQPASIGLIDDNGQSRLDVTPLALR